MEYINLLLFASPGELERMRGEMGNFLHELNGCAREFRYELGVVEAVPTSSDGVGMLRDCRLVCVVAGRDAAEPFLREFDALMPLLGDSAPEIRAYAAPEAEETAFRLAVRLRKSGFACGTFSHPDAVKLDLLLSLERLDLLSGPLEFRDSEAVVDGTPVLSLLNAPVYAKQEELKKLLPEKDRLEKEFRRLHKASPDPGDAAALKELLDVTRRRGELTQKIRTTEASLLELCQAVAGAGQSTWRVRQAGRLLEEGNFPGALEVLKNDRRQEELNRAERVRKKALELADRQLVKVRDCIKEDRLRIAALKTTGEDTLSKLSFVYDETAALAEKYRVELDVLYEYANFLWEQQAYPEALRVGARLERYYREDGAPAEDQASLQSLLGNCCLDGEDTRGAEDHYREALDLYQGLWQENPEEWAADMASASADLASLLHMNGRLQEAEAYYRDALEIRRNLARSPLYAPDAAETCIRLANLLSAAGRTDEAARFYREVLDFTRRPSAASAPFAAAANRNLAALMRQAGDLKEAERCYRPALDGFRALADEDPGEWSADAASVCRDYAQLLDGMGRAQDAEPLYREALERMRALEREDPEEWAEPMALTCEDLANLSREAGKPSESLYREALDRFYALAEAQPGEWDAEIAEASGALAELLRDDGRLLDAEPLCRDALERFRLLSDEDPDTYDPDVAVNFGLLSSLLKDTGRTEEAEPLCREALERFRELEAAEPDAWSRQIAAACGNLAGLLKDAGEQEEAEELYREALDRFRRLTDQSSPSPEAASVCRDLADLLGRTGRAQEAERLYCEALDVYRKLAEKRPAQWEPEVAMTSNNLAVFLKGAGRPEAADWFYRVALDSYRKLAKKNSDLYAPYVAATCSNLASLLSDTGRNAEAERFYRVSLDAWKHLAEKTPEAYEPDVADTCSYLAVFLLAVKHDRKESKALYQQALSLYEKYPHLSEKAAGIRKVLEENYTDEEE